MTTTATSIRHAGDGGTVPAGEARYARVSFLGIALAATLFATPTVAIEFVGKVVGVTDGDTITVLVERRAIKVRRRN